MDGVTFFGKGMWVCGYVYVYVYVQVIQTNNGRTVTMITFMGGWGKMTTRRRNSNIKYHVEFVEGGTSTTRDNNT